MAGEQLNEQQVRGALADFLDPETGRSVVEMEQLGDVKVDGNAVRVSLGLTSHSAVLRDEVKERLVARLKERLGDDKQIDVDITSLERPAGRIGQIGLTAKSVIAVGSGKGGVGKSTIATALALGLARAGSKVGLMDADVYGPSIPHLLGVNQRPEVADNRIQPIEASGLKVISMGFLVPPGEAVVWRGPMLHGAITQFLRDTAWGDLDYLIIDLPPGTGDIVLTLTQLLPLSGAVVVCTPQDVALLDAVKAVAMFRKVNTPILGMVENMSGFVCPDCGKRYDIFGSGGARKRAEELGIPFLGEVPINMQIRALGDEGRSAANYDDAQVAATLLPLCRNLVRNLSETPSAGGSLPVLTT